MEELKELIKNVKENVDKMTELFYQQKNNEALGYMNPMLDSIVAISGIIPQIEGAAKEDSDNLLKILGEAVAAMENKDYVMLADVLKYDMIDLLDKIYNMVG